MAQPKFSRKAVQTPTQGSGTGTTVDPQAWNTWNEYIFEQHPASASKVGGKEVKERFLIGRTNMVFDMGLPAAADSMWDLKSGITAPENGEDYSESEKEYLKANPTHDFVWNREWDDVKKCMTERRKQTSPSFPQQEYGICVDFPEWLVDYSKHPYSQSQEPLLRPYRISLNGDFAGNIQKPIVFQGHWKTGLVSDKNIVYKICKASGREQELIDSGFDIGTVAEATCNFKVTAKLQKKEDKVFLNTSANTPTKVDDIKERGGDIYSAQEQIEDVMKVEGLQPFVGILLDMEDYDDLMFDMVGEHDTHKYVKRASTSKKWTISGTNANGPYSFEKGIMIQGEDGNDFAVDYDQTPFAKAYSKWLEFKGNTSTQETVDKPATVVKDKPKQEVKEPVKVVTEPTEEYFDDTEIPFAPIGLQYPALLLCI